MLMQILSSNAKTANAGIAIMMARCIRDQLNDPIRQIGTESPGNTRCFCHMK